MERNGISTSVRSPAFRRKFVCFFVSHKTHDTNFRLKAGLRTVFGDAMIFSNEKQGSCFAVAITFITIIAATTSAQQNWPSFRGANASGVADGKPTPTIWDATKGTNILWMTPIPGLAHASPVVWGDKVFITTAVSSKGGEYFRHGLY